MSNERARMEKLGRVAVRAVFHLLDRGPCEHSGGAGYCDREECSYCDLARACSLIDAAEIRRLAVRLGEL